MSRGFKPKSGGKEGYVLILLGYITETLPINHSQVTADYSNVFTMNPPTADVTQEL
jgi:hypothetical protein